MTPLADCLAAVYPKVRLTLQSNMTRALGAGGLPFEVIAGVPAEQYGARVTFRPVGDPARLATAFGLERHPWGVPSWVGVRIASTGAGRVKPYHRLTRIDDRFALPAGLTGDLYPVAASLDGDKTELYLRCRSPMPWQTFVEATLAPLGGGEYPFAPWPCSRSDSFGFSMCWSGTRLQAVSLYAFSGALPDDFSIERQWASGMTEIDRTAYAMAITAVRSLGRLTRGKRHGLLAWTLERGAKWHRAASLRIVPTSS